MSNLQFDYSTINLPQLDLRPAYKLPPTYYLQKHSEAGNGCFLDPPGYPTYFTQSVYTQYGNNPSRGPQMVICIPGHGVRVVQHHDDWKGRDWDQVKAIWERRMRRLYVKLPLEHPRVQAWISQLFGYFGNSYVDPNRPEEVRRNIDKLVKIGTPDQLRAVVDVREFYREFDPANAPAGTWGVGKGNTGDWWERYGSKPRPEECPGIHGNKHGTYDHCQMCGWWKETKVTGDV